MCEHFTKFKDNSARKIRTKKLNIISASKGIEQKTLFLPHEILKRIWNEKANVGALSGPSFAQEMREGLPTCVVIASRSQILLTKATAILHNPYFRIYDTKDIMGVEIAGALKNIIAIVSGAVDGLNLGHNARAAVMTRGLAEIVRIGVFLGAEPLTFLGLSGVGDLILTCTGHLSRNRQFGYRMTQGESVADILKSTHQVVEGIATAKSAYELCQKHKIDSPILSAVYKVLYEDFPLRDAISLFIEREHGKEFNFVKQGICGV
jgi:glycerol-3-phosphate dehydrogenase (NAD(P)+)